jgi:hypothetical protein
MVVPHRAVDQGESPVPLFMDVHERIEGKEAAAYRREFN